MPRLLYHRPHQSDAVSPFDEAVLEAAGSGPLRIACPYIGVGYLMRALASSEDWQLISDVQEWMTVLPRRARPMAWQFIREHGDRIHHYQDLHAKVVIGGRAAMMGSANLTRRGILGRAEMGMLLDDPAHVAELVEWFDSLWEETAPLEADEANAFIQWLDAQAGQSPARREQFAFSNQGRRIRARLAQLPLGVPATPAATAALLLERVAQEVVLEEQTHFASIEEAFEAILEKLVSAGVFTLGDAVAALRRRFASAAVREVYYLVLRHCANHPRSVFADGTLNRLVLDAGRFMPSTRETLGPALAPFDRFLARLLDSLEFATAQGMRSEESVEQDTGIPGRHQVLLVAELLDVGLLVLEDVPGELPRYRLDRAFEWEGRFNLFSTAHAVWRRKAAGPVCAPSLRSQDETEDDEDRWLDHLGLDSLPEMVEGSDGSFNPEVVERDLRSAATHASRNSLSQAQRIKRALKQAKQTRREARRNAVDGWLAALVGLMASGTSFRGVDFKTVASAAADASGVDEDLAFAVLDPNSDAPRLFDVVPSKGGGWELGINSALTWKMLGRYPKTKAACEALLTSSANQKTPGEY